MILGLLYFSRSIIVHISYKYTPLVQLRTHQIYVTFCQILNEIYVIILFHDIVHPLTIIFHSNEKSFIRTFFILKKKSFDFYGDFIVSFQHFIRSIVLKTNFETSVCALYMGEMSIKRNVQGIYELPGVLKQVVIQFLAVGDIQFLELLFRCDG